MAEIQQPADAPKTDDPSLRIEWGEALTLAQCYSISSGEKTLFIVLAGASNTGKTTFLINLFDLFQHGLIDNYLFAGSRTLIGFEQRLHSLRILDSDREAAVARTPSSTQPQVLHIRVVPTGQMHEPINLLIADISGEQFKDARDDESAARALTFLSEADSIVFFANAELVESEMTISNAIRDARLISRRFFELRLLKPSCGIFSVLSKVDALVGSVSRTEVLKKLTEAIETQATENGYKTHPAIAVRSVPVEETEGVKDLLTLWMKDKRQPRQAVGPSRSGESSFRNFGLTSGGIS